MQVVIVCHDIVQILIAVTVRVVDFPVYDSIDSQP